MEWNRRDGSLGWTLGSRFWAHNGRGVSSLVRTAVRTCFEACQPVRLKNRRESRVTNWWRHGEARPGLRKKLEGLSRYIVTSEKSKYRFFVWLPASVVPDHRLIVFPKDDETFFGILSSRFHVCWALAVGSTLEDRPAYATTSCFDKFPFPDGLAPSVDAGESTNTFANAIGAAAAQLDGLREAWLNPPELVDRVPEVLPIFPERIVPKSGREAEVRQRTMTDLYNSNPTWLINAHRALDEAVAHSYGWTDYTPEMPDEEILRVLLDLNSERTTS